MVFLPGNKALFAEKRNGKLNLIDLTNNRITALSGLPGIYTKRDSGLFEVSLHPHYGKTGWIYLVYSIGDDRSSTLVMDRAKLSGTELIGWENIYTLEPSLGGEDFGYHYGGRIAFDKEGYLYLSIGDRHHADLAQDRSNAVGSIIRLYDDGRLPADNPFVGQKNMRSEIWSYGHRNPQGLAFDPETGVLWSHEHGPLGGDELNIIVKAKNYGWPVVTYGKEYDGTPIGKGITTAKGMEPPRLYWNINPSGIGPSDMVFYSHTAFPDWRGSVFIGSMSKTHLRRLVIAEGRILHEEELLKAELNQRIRMVRQGPGGALYLGTDSGYLLKLSPINNKQ